MSDIRLHVIWTREALHLWGEDVQRVDIHAVGEGPEPTCRTDEPQASARADGASVCAMHADRPVMSLPPHPFALTHHTLRDLAAETSQPRTPVNPAESSLTLRLPSDHRGPWPSVAASYGPDHSGMLLRRWTVPSLALTAAEGLEWLAGLRAFAASPAVQTSGVQFWRCCARLVLSLAARHRFTPDVAEIPPARLSAYWRCVIDQATFQDQIAPLTKAFPRVCASFLPEEPASNIALELVDSFLRTAMDAFIRRCLYEDELYEAIRDRAHGVLTGATRWLLALMDGASVIRGSTEEQVELQGRVRSWLSRIDSGEGRQRFRTLIRLHAPPDAPPCPAEPVPKDWRLTFHLQSVDTPSLVLDVADVAEYQQRTGRLLYRPGEDCLEQLRRDMRTAARHFAPLATTAESPLPDSCPLDVFEAHLFLRQALPMLTLEGLAVETPGWWTPRRPRVGLSVNLGPAASQEGASFHLGIESLVHFDWRVAVGDRELTAGDVQALLREGRPLARIGGEWIEVQKEPLEQALDLLTRPPTKSTTLAEALRQAFYEEHSQHGLPILDVRATGWLENLLGDGKTSTKFELLLPPEAFVGTLRSYQIRGLSWLAFLDRYGLGACLADDMGLGKTIQLIALLLHERRSGSTVGPTLIIVPMSVVGNWQHELRRFAPSLRVLVHHGLERLSGDAFSREVECHDVVISTYGLAHRDFEHLDRIAWRRIVLDEAQNIKNPGSKQSVAVRRLRGARRVALTGTPIENRLGELWSIFDFLNPSLLGSLGEFRRIFAGPIERQADARRSARLRRLIRPFLLRRGKTDPEVDVDLPEKLEMTVYCNLTREQARLYERVTTQMLGQIDEAGGIRRKGLILTAILKLKQVCNHPAQFLGETRGDSQRSGKSRRIIEMIEEIVSEGERALVFTQFRRMGDLLERMLAAALHRPILFLHGGTPEPRRRELVERFQQDRDDSPVLILSLKAGGVGLNLTAATHVFHFDRWWNPAVENQATDRAHRIGQHRKVQVHKFVCIGTLEERIDAMLRHKKDLADAIVGSGEDWLTELSTEGLRDLFRLSREAISD